MQTLPDGGVPSLSRDLSPDEVSMSLTTCGLLVERAESLARLYRDHGTWNEVKELWFDERLANRSTRGSAQKIYGVLTARLQNAPTTLPNPAALPLVLDDCATPQDKAQVLALYLLADDALVQYVVHEYAQRAIADAQSTFDFSNEAIVDILDGITYTDGSGFDYAESTTRRWCEGFRSLMREISALEAQTVEGTPPAVGDVPLLVALGHSYGVGGDAWYETPLGLCWLLQPAARWDELFDRAVGTGVWEFIELHGSLQLNPVDETYSWIDGEVTADE